jgi:hypothetical protein
MVDPMMTDFERRLARIRKGHSKGRPFEAQGTLGALPYRESRPRIPIVRPVLFVLAVAIGLKGVIHYSIGANTYDRRVEALRKGDDADKIAAMLMQADPATLFVSKVLQGQ